MPVLFDAESSASASVRIVSGGIAVVRMGGEVTAQSILTLVSTAEALSAGRGVSGAIVDYRFADLDATPIELLRSIIRGGHPGVMSMPVAVAARPSDIPYFRAHCLECARRGLWRRTFLDTLSAHSWLMTVLDDRSVLDIDA